MKTELKNKKLTGKQVRYLKGLGHHLKPLVMLGRDGLSQNVITAANAVLASHEHSEIVQILGKTFLLFRPNPDRNDEHRIKLPS
jgi:RNA-binding protein